jgi:magnesium transporter
MPLTDSVGPRISADGSVRENLETVEFDGFSWIDACKPTRAEMEILARRYNFHMLNIEDSLTKNQLTKIDRYESHVFVVLLLPAYGKEAAKGNATKFSQLSVFVGRNYLVTVHQGDLKPLTEMFELCKGSDRNARRKIMGRSAAYLFHGIIDALVDELLHMTRKVIGNLDDIEDSVFDESRSAAREIATLRREIMILRHTVNPLKRVILEFGSRDAPRFSEGEIDADLARYYADVNDHVAKVAETLDEAKETAEIFKDSNFMLSTERSNKVLQILTVVFTLFIPAMSLASIYGVNVQVPGTLQSGAWTFWGPYTSLAVIVLISISSVLAMLWYFRAKGWLTAG